MQTRPTSITLTTPRARGNKPGWAYLLTLVIAAFIPCGVVFADRDIEVDRDKFTRLMETKIPELMSATGVVGTVVSVVKGGEVFYNKGFGISDQDRNTPVDAERTLFRPGSISKVFTWTGIMQLVERGQLSLEDEVRLLVPDIPIDDRFDEPIRVKHLMAHSAGFETPGLGHLFERDPKQVLPLRSYLQKFIPKQVRRPGSLSVYSNYSTALAGQIIANVSKMSFEDYMEENIFHPIGMYNSSFREPLGEQFPDNMPPDLAARVSKGFSPNSDGHRQSEFVFISGIGPAGALSSTAPDMAQFMLAHLGQGKNEIGQILQPETARWMQTPNFFFTSDKTIAIAHGFFSYPLLGHNRLGHDGGTVHFESQMGLYPDLDLGIFISTNTAGGSALHAQLEKLIVEQLAGDATKPVTELTPPPAGERDYQRFVGSYQSARRVYSNIESLMSLTSGVLEISLSDDGYLKLKGGPAPDIQLVEVAPLLFRIKDKNRYFEFVEDSTGKITHLKSTSGFDKIGWLQRPDTKLNSTLISLALLLVSLSAFIYKSRQKFRRSESTEEKIGRQIALGTSLIWPVFFGFFAVDLGSMTAEGFPFDFPSTLTKFTLGLGIIGTLLTCATLVYNAVLWRRTSWSRPWRLTYLATSLAAMVIVACLNSFHVIGFNYF